MGSQDSSGSRSKRFRRQFTFGPRDEGRSGLLAALIVLLIGTVVSLAAFFAIRENDLREKRTDLEYGSEQLATMVDTGLSNVLEVFRLLPAFYASSQVISNEEFRTFVRGALTRHRDGIAAFQRIRLVSRDARGIFEKEAGFLIRNPDHGVAGPRDVYMPILFQEPADPDVLGIDMAFGTETAAAIDEARKGHEMVTSEPFMREGERLLAVYQTATTSERRSGLVGVILRIDRILQNIVDASRLTGLHIALVDSASGDLLYANTAGARRALSKAEARTDWPIAAAGEWELQVAPVEGSHWSEVSAPWFYLVGGLVLSVLLAIGTVALITIAGLRRRVEEALQLGQYRLETKLGEGGMGEVYRASHAMLRRPTAVKLLTADRAAGDTLARFEREVQLTSQLTHPNTVAIFDYGHTPKGTFYYAMEFLEGLHPDDLVKIGGPIPAGRVIHLLEQVCGSLAEAHGAGLVHRDVKPANILVCERGGQYDFVKVLDFGLVKDIGNDDSTLTRADSFVGTPQYMSPEAARSAPSMDGRGDLYSVGAIGYLMLAGQPPFTGVSSLEIITKHATEIPRPPSEVLGQPIDDDLETVVLRCLEKDPDARYANANDLRDALLACGAAGTWTAADARAWWELQRQRSG